MNNLKVLRRRLKITYVIVSAVIIFVVTCLAFQQGALHKPTIFYFETFSRNPIILHTWTVLTIAYMGAFTALMIQSKRQKQRIK